MSDEPASNPPKRSKTYTELAQEFPDNPGLRMLAGAEAWCKWMAR